MEDKTDTKPEQGNKEGEKRLDGAGLYETGDEVVLYDTERPLAWVQADNAVELSEMV